MSVPAATAAAGATQRRELQLLDCRRMTNAPRAVVANSGGEITDVAGLRAAARAGNDVFPLDPADLVPLPDASRLLFLPGRTPLAYERGGAAEPEPLDGALAVAAFLPPGWTGLSLSAFRREAERAAPPALRLHRGVLAPRALLRRRAPGRRRLEARPRVVLAGRDRGAGGRAARAPAEQPADRPPRRALRARVGLPERAEPLPRPLRGADRARALVQRGVPGLHLRAAARRGALGAGAARASSRRSTRSSSSQYRTSSARRAR